MLYKNTPVVTRTNPMIRIGVATLCQLSHPIPILMIQMRITRIVSKVVLVADATRFVISQPAWLKPRVKITCDAIRPAINGLY